VEETSLAAYLRQNGLFHYMIVPFRGCDCRVCLP
jgi:hypothetical protein